MAARAMAQWMMIALHSATVYTYGMRFFLVYFILGSAGGFLSGLLGVGGALVMIPMMLTIPPLFGLEPLTMQAVAGLSMIQVVFASISGVLQHRKNHFVHMRLLWIVGLCMFAASLTGAVASQYVCETTMLVLFGVMLLIGTVMMAFPSPRHLSAFAEGDEVRFNPYLAAGIGLGVGLVAGMIGAGGGFVIVPMMIYVLRIPVKVAIGTSLGVVLIGSLAGGAGKIFTGQVAWLPATALILGAIALARYGAIVSKKVTSRMLRYLLLIVLLASCVQIGGRIYSIFFPS